MAIAGSHRPPYGAAAHPVVSGDRHGYARGGSVNAQFRDRARRTAAVTRSAPAWNDVESLAGRHARITDGRAFSLWWWRWPSRAATPIIIGRSVRPHRIDGMRIRGRGRNRLNTLDAPI